MAWGRRRRRSSYSTGDFMVDDDVDDFGVDEVGRAQFDAMNEAYEADLAEDARRARRAGGEGREDASWASWNDWDDDELGDELDEEDGDFYGDAADEDLAFETGFLDVEDC